MKKKTFQSTNSHVFLNLSHLSMKISSNDCPGSSTAKGTATIITKIAPTPTAIPTYNNFAMLRAQLSSSERFEEVQRKLKISDLCVSSGSLLLLHSCFTWCRQQSTRYKVHSATHGGKRKVLHNLNCERERAAES